MTGRKQSVPHESVLGLLLFNLFIWDLFLLAEETDVMIYACYNTPYVFFENTDVTRGKKLEEVGKKFFERFLHNFLRVNSNNAFYALITDESYSININNEVMTF